MKNLSKEEQRELDVREAELKLFLDENPHMEIAQRELEIKMMGVPEAKRLEVLFMLVGDSLRRMRDKLK